MTNRRRTLIAALLCALALGLFVGGASAAEQNWPALYANALTALVKAGGPSKHVAALADLTGDGEPEMIYLALNADKGAALSFYGPNGTAIARKPLSATGAAGDRVPFAGVSSAKFELRVSAAGQPCALVSVKAKQSGYAYLYTYAFSATESAVKGELAIAKATKNGKPTRYYQGATQITAAQYKQLQTAFSAKYVKKVQSIPIQQLTKKESASGVKSKVNALWKKYKTAARVGKIAINKSSMRLEAGTNYALKTKISPASALFDKLTWSSSDPDVASVDQSGVVTGLKAGTATIAVRAASGKAKSCKVTVTQPDPKSVTLSSSLTLAKGDTARLTASIAPANAKDALAWKSSNPSVAQIDADGNVIAKKKGTAQITVKTVNGKTDTCIIKVIEEVQTGYVLDISHYNKVTDWNALQESVDFLILRATCGMAKDNKIDEYAQACNARGIPFGVYCYAKAQTPEEAEQEARFLVNTAKKYNPNFYVYDVELSYLNDEICARFTDTLRALGVKKTGYYIAHHLYSRYKLNTKKVDFVWIPHYGKNDGTRNSKPSYACDMHQYTSKGRVSGVSGNVDMNQLTGSKSLSFFTTK